MIAARFLRSSLAASDTSTNFWFLDVDLDSGADNHGSGCSVAAGQFDILQAVLAYFYAHSVVNGSVKLLQ